jgi:outer membrane protein TolC
LPSVNVIAGYGSNQSAPMLNDAYQNLLTQRNITLGLYVPIINAGGNTANIKIANYQIQNIDYQTQLLERQFRNELLIQIQALNLTYSQLITVFFKS